MSGLLSKVIMADNRLRLATTTSTENSGLLRHVLPLFETKNNCIVDVIAVGTGKALKLGERGDVDLVLVHAPDLEKQFVDSGFGVNHKAVMYNDFVIIGPVKDPASVSKAKTAEQAMQFIAKTGATFISRGDNSGTHFKEIELWKQASVNKKQNWYLEAGRGMGEVITMANEQLAYTLADRSTFLAFSERIDLQVLFQGDIQLFNPYGVIAVNPDSFPHVNYQLATSFIDYLISDNGKKLIREFKRNGEQLFFIDEKLSH